MKLRITIDGKTYEAEVEILDAEGDAPDVSPYPPAPPSFVPASLPESMTSAPTGAEENEKECRSPVTGMVIKVNVEPGQIVESSDIVMVLESMKMEMQIAALKAGVVKHVFATAGSSVKVNQVLLEFE